jgi:hypothetical protein
VDAWAKFQEHMFNIIVVDIYIYYFTYIYILLLYIYICSKKTEKQEKLKSGEAGIAEKYRNAGIQKILSLIQK